MTCRPCCAWTRSCDMLRWWCSDVTDVSLLDWYNSSSSPGSEQFSESGQMIINRIILFDKFGLECEMERNGITKTTYGIVHTRLEIRCKGSTLGSVWIVSMGSPTTQHGGHFASAWTSVLVFSRSDFELVKIQTGCFLDGRHLYDTPMLRQFFNITRKRTNSDDRIYWSSRMKLLH